MNWNSAVVYVLVAGAIGCGGTAIVGTEHDANAAPTSDPNATAQFSDGNSTTHDAATGPADPNALVTLATMQEYCRKTQECVREERIQSVEECTQMGCKFFWPLRDGYVADVANDPKLCNDPRSVIPFGSSESPKRRRFAELCTQKNDSCPGAVGSWCEGAPGMGEAFVAAITPCLEPHVQCSDISACAGKAAAEIKPPSWCPGATPITAPPPPIR